MFICSKLRQNLSEIQDIVRIQRVIWDHLLAFKGEIIQRQALFSLPYQTPEEFMGCFNICCLFCLHTYINSFVLFSTPLKSFFRLNHVRRAWNRCFHSRFSSEAIIQGFFYRNVGLCCCGRPRLLCWVKQWREVKENVINSGFLPFCWNLNMIKLDS